MIPQSVRFQRHPEEMPTQFNDLTETSIAHVSWFLGITCVVLAITSTVALMLSIHQRIVLTWSAIAVCAAVFVILATLFKAI